MDAYHQQDCKEPAPNRCHLTHEDKAKQECTSVSRQTESVNTLTTLALSRVSCHSHTLCPFKLARG